MRWLRRSLFFAALSMIVLLVLRPHAQTQAPPRRVFEVASIKPNISGPPAGPLTNPLVFSPGGRFSAINVTLVDVIVRVYPTRRIQMQGGPAWIDSDRFDIIAKADEADGEVTQEQKDPMVQALLEDRFKLSFHKETKDMQVYALVLGKDAPKLKTSETGGVNTFVPGMRGQMTFKHMPIAGLVNTLANILRTPVVDGTGLPGFYDFALDPVQFMVPPAAGADRTAGDTYDFSYAVVKAIEEQLGFKLEKRKEPLEITVVDRAEKPTDN